MKLLLELPAGCSTDYMDNHAYERPMGHLSLSSSLYGNFQFAKEFLKTLFIKCCGYVPERFNRGFQKIL